jgi:hypothetical protein
LSAPGERSLTTRERQILDYLLRGDSSTAAALRRQAAVARVLQESPCCASIHLYADPAEAADAPAAGITIIEAEWKGSPRRSVRLTTSGEARLSHLELVHEKEEIAPPEFPLPRELAEPSWISAAGSRS